MKITVLSVFTGNLLAAVLLLSSCSYILFSDDNAPNEAVSGWLKVSLLSGSPRTIYPPVDMTMTSFDIFGTGPGDASFSAFGVTGSGYTAENIVTGSWTVTVDGRNDSGEIIMIGSTVAEIVSGGNSIAIDLCPLTGEGYFQVEITWPEEIISVGDISITSTASTSEGVPVPLSFPVNSGSATLNESIEAGYYIWNLLIEEGGRTRHRMPPKVFRIISEKQTEFLLNLSLSDLNILPKVAAGSGHSFFLESGGILWGVGKNTSGQLGISNNTDLNSFSQIISDVYKFGCGRNHSFIIKTDWTLWASGFNGYGQLGTGDEINTNTFVQVLSNVKDVVGGDGHSLALTRDGILFASGLNSDGQLGTGESGYSTNKNTFTQVMTEVNSIAIGRDNSFALKSDGTLWASGKNDFGSLGTGDNFTLVGFSQIAADVSKVVSGGYFTLIQKTDGTLWGTGYNGFGELGTGDNIDSNVFIQLLSDVKDVSCGSNYCMVQKTEGTVYGTGSNLHGQLGLGDNTDRNSFTQIPITNVWKVVTGTGGSGTHTMILKNDDTVWLSGDNQYGQLGTGDNLDRNIFTQVGF